MIRQVLILTFFLSGLTAFREGAQLMLKGKVIRIIDGDTYELLVNQRTYKIRMHGIDAPERTMPYYQVSKDYLASLCFNKEVSMQQTDTDRNGRIVGKTFSASGVELGWAMVNAGMAWHFVRYSNDPMLAQAEAGARKLRKGLWADANPIAPWDWRKQRKRK